MKKILWHSHSPLVSTGYGMPTALWTPRLREMGYEVTISAFAGQGMDCTVDGIPVINTDDEKLGATKLRKLTKDFDILITLMDIWALSPDVLSVLKIPVINWMPVDTTPLSILDIRYFKHSKGVPVALSEHGKKMLDAAGFDGHAIPYAFDPGIFYLDENERELTRQAKNLDGKFVIGINASNVERKAWAEQFYAYALFQQKHPGDVILLAHTDKDGMISLPPMVKSLGIPDEAIRWSRPGMMDQPMMATWYRSLDILLSCSYAEGFCLPVAEAQACGCPVIVTGAPPVGTEAGLVGRHVPCEPIWHQSHEAWWHRPSIAGIYEALEDAFSSPRETKTQLEYIRKYSVDNVAPLWAELLEKVA